MIDAVFLVALGALGLSVMRVAEGSDTPPPPAAGPEMLAAQSASMPLSANQGETLVSARVTVDKRGGLIFPGDEVLVEGDNQGASEPLGPLTVVAIEQRPGLDRPALITFSVPREASRELRRMREETELYARLHKLSVRGDAYGLAQLPEAQVITRRYETRDGAKTAR